MRKSICLLAFALASIFAEAQTMTDAQVLQYVQTEQAKGTSQQTIVSKLLQSGVTTDQLRRVRKRYESEQGSPGALTTTTQKQGQSQKNEGMGRLRELDTNQTMTRSERMEALMGELTFLDEDSIDMFMGAQKRVFGRDIFRNDLLTFEPNQNMATPPNYRLGAGDAVIIDVWGSTQVSFEGTISPDGVVVIDGIGPVKLAGLTVSQAEAKLRSQVGQYYRDCNISLSLGENRSIQVQVMGEVVAPGTYTVSSLSSAMNALYAAGGISEIGTLRNIKIYRGGRTVAVLDVYDYILNGNATGDMRLQDNDVIVVGPYECLVEVTGKVKRPMFYEMKSTETVQQVIKDAGGFTGDAYTKNVRLSRKAGDEYTMHTVDEFQMGGFTLKDGDSLYVDSVIARYSNMVEVRGAVMHAGQYQLGGSVQSVRALLNVADGPREDAFLSRGVMHRLKDDLTLEMISVDVEGILNGTTPDVPLRNGDVLFIPSATDMRGEQTLQITGQVMYPGTYQFAEGTCVEDLVLMAGGLKEGASMAKVDVFRRIQNASATEQSEAIVESFSVSLRDGFRSGDTDLVLQPFDEVVVRKSPAYSEQQNVTIRGCVNFEGDYAMETRDYRISDLVKAAGGLSELAYSEGARLMRKLTEEERLQREGSMRAAQIQLYEEALLSEKAYNLAQADSLMTLKLDLGGDYPVAVNLKKALDNPGGSDDIVLREGDIITVPQYSNTVKVSGEVIYPISMNYKRGESLSYYVERAGGYGNKAKKKGAYAIYLNGAAKKIGRRGTKDIQPGCEIVIPTKSTSGKKMSTAEIMAISSGAASLATVVVALMNIIK